MTETITSAGALPTDLSKDIAIIGMSTFCPGASTLGEYWRNLVNGVDSTTDVPEDVLDPFYFGAKDNKAVDKFYCNRGGFGSHAVADPLRYGIMPVTAEGSDPDQLLSLMLTELALNNAGIPLDDPLLANGAVIIGRGSFAGLPQLRGAGIVRYANEIVSILQHALPGLSQSDLDKVKKEYAGAFGRYQADTATSSIPNLVASLVSNYFDMHGPAYVIDGACASGLIALEHGIRLLRNGETDVAVIGAMHTDHNAVFWSAFTMMGALSYKGVTAAFSKDADGLLISQGAGYLIIKTLKNAIEHGDRIYAVIKGCAVGSDGGGHSVLVTSSSGQVPVVRKAWEDAGMDPHDVGLIEGHGTGTPVGDAVEAESMAEVFGDSSYPPAYIGSVKSNIGHTMPAAGMLGLIKTTLALYHHRIPPTLHCENPSQSLLKSRFKPPQETLDWDETGLPLTAGVNAFGFGGINAHAVLTAYQEPPEKQAFYRADRRRHYTPVAHAVSAPDLESLLSKLDFYHGKNGVGSFLGAPDDRYRLVVFNPTDERIQQAVQIVKRDQPWLGRGDFWFTNEPLLADGGKLAFMFPGWDTSERTEHDSITDELGLPWNKVVSKQSEEANRIYREEWTKYSEHAVGADVNLDAKSWNEDWADRVAMGQLVDQALRATGVRADMYFGQSMGEWYAAQAVGMLDPKDAQAVTDFLMAPENSIPEELLPDWTLLAVSGKLSDKARAQILTTPDVNLTADNCPSQFLICVLNPSMPVVEEILNSEHVLYHPLPFPSGMHTPYIHDVLDVMLEQLEPIALGEPDTPVWSASSRAQILGNQSAAKAFKDKFDAPVRFRELVEELYERENARVFIQIGSGPLAGFVEDILSGRKFAALSSIIPGQTSVDQLRRVHALMFIMGGHADLEFMNTGPIYRTMKSLYFMPLGAPIIDHLDSLNEVLSDYVPPSAVEEKIEAAVEAAVAAIPVPSVATPASPASPALVPNQWRKGTGILPPRGFTRGYNQQPTMSMAPVGTPLPVAPLPGTPVPGTPVPPSPMAPVSSGPAPGAPVGAPAAPAVTPVAPPAPTTPAPAGATPQASEAKPPPRRAGTKFEEPLDFDLDTYPYVMDHSIVNQPLGWHNPHDAYPVIPLTMSIEVLAAIAKKHAPGQRVIKIGPMTAFDFIPVNDPWHGVVEGLWKGENLLSLSIPGKIKVDITVGTHPPEVPTEWVEQTKKDVGEKIKEPLPPDEVYYKYGFHRPRYQSLDKGVLYAEHGFVNLISKREGMGSLLDQMGQTIGLYLHVREQSNQVSFPVRLTELTFYQDIEDQSGTFENYCVIRHVTDSFIFADVIYLRDEKVWAIARGWVNQRIGINLDLWRAIISPQVARLAEHLGDNAYYVSGDGEQPLNRSSQYFLYLRYLTGVEKDCFNQRNSEEAQADFLAGRIALKDAVRSALRDGENPMLYPIEIGTRYDESGKIEVMWENGSPLPTHLDVSVAHKNTRGVAIVGSKPVGIDIEEIAKKEQGFWDLTFTATEQELLRAQPDPDLAAIRFWVAKEAYGKMLGIGLNGDPRKHVVTRVDDETLTIDDVVIHTTERDGHIIGWTV